MTPICLTLIFRTLFIKLVTKYTLEFNRRFLKQVDGCTLRISLFVTFSDMYMVKMENDIVMSSKMEKDVVKPSKPIFYHRFADDIYSRRKLGDNFLFD